MARETSAARRVASTGRGLKIGFGVGAHRLEEDLRQRRDGRVDACSDIDRHVVLLGGEGEYHGASDVVDMDEVHRLFTVAIDDRCLTRANPVHEVIDD